MASEDHTAPSHLAGRLAREGRLQHLSAEERAALAAFGRRLRALREEASAQSVAAGGERVTLAVLAARVGLDASVLGEMERGRGNASLSTIVRLAQAFDVPLIAFFAE